jgi:cellulase (glycosyl hydrolase family 5)
VTVALRYGAVAGATLVLVAATASAGSANGVRTYTTGGTAPFATALADPGLFPSSQKATAFALTRAAGATYVRLAVTWRTIAPSTRPDGFVATDPTSPGYSWGGLDSAVEAADSAGLTPILDISSVPKWAFARVPDPPNAGSPRASALGEFATALATHFDGSADGVPVERIFQVWNEPNLTLDLSPVSASTYRKMVNAVADAVHAVDPANLVVAGALEPVGHKKVKGQKWYSVRPLAFMRSLLCVSKGAHPHSTCSKQIRFDVWSHHPYTHGGPFGRAQIPDDVMLGDMPKMRALLNAGVRFHHVRSAQRVQFWVTEFGWDTNPPRRHAASLALAARWTAESFHQMWLSGVSLATWFLLQDYRSPSPYQSGLYFRSGSLDSARPKGVLTAFRFPFVAYLHKSTVSTWGRVATSDQRLVTIQFRPGKSGTWRTVALIRSNGYGIFKAKLRLKATTKGWLRAVAPGSGTSLAFSFKVPHAPNIGPWGY